MSLSEQSMDPYMSVPKVAQLFDVKPETVRNWITDGKLKAMKLNGYWKIPRSEVVKLGKSMYGA